MNAFLHGVAQASVAAFNLSGPVLEIGSCQIPGQEAIADLRGLFPGQRYLGLDCRPGRGVDVIADAEDLPYPDGSFDVVVSTISMHHWYELEQPLRDLYRVLRPGGRLWIYDFRFVTPQTVAKALANTPFAGTPLEHTWVRTGALPLALYQRFALQKLG